MSIFQIFEQMRRANADFYTANPLEQLSDDDLTRLASEAGLTLEDLREQMTTPSVKLTCPLCGQPATHLVNCRGCGGDAFGGEWVMAHGERMHSQLKAGLRIALSHSTEASAPFSQAQIEAATEHAYQWGGCQICVECWHHTLPSEAYQTCPLKLLADHTLAPEQPPGGLMYAVFTAETPEGRRQAVQEWIEAGWRRWVEVWNTATDTQVRQAIAAWRQGILEAVWRQE